MSISFRHRLGRITVVGLSSVALAATSMVTVTGAAHADPEDDLERVRERVEQVSEQVDALYLEAEIANEQYLQAKERYEQTQDDLARAKEAVTRQEATVAEMGTQMGTFAAAAYRRGMVDSLLHVVVSENPSEALDESVMIDAYANHQAAALARVAEEREQLSRQQADVDEKTAMLTVIESDLADQKRAVDEKVDEAEALLASLEEEEQEILAEIERQRRLEAERQARIAAQVARDAERQRLAAEQQAQQQAQQQTQQQPDQQTSPGAPAAQSESNPAPPPPPASGRAAAAVQFALAQIGDPYVYGGTGPNGWDCSGLTSGAWAAAGVSVPRTSQGQFYGLPRVSMNALQPGDIIGYYGGVSHVGIYIGNGQIVHSSRPGRPVSVASLYSMPVMGAVRPG